RLVLQVPARPLLEGDTVTLRCQGWKNMSVTQVQFYHGDKEVSRSPSGTELSLSPLQLNHSGQYHCRGWLNIGVSWQWQQLAPVNVTVHDWLVLQVPVRPLLEGDTVTLRSRGWRDMSVTQVRFYQGNEEVSRSPSGTELSLSPLHLNHSGDYHCRGQVYSEVSRSWVQHKSAPVTLIMHGEPHPHSLPGPPGWGHSTLSGDPQPCL
ncbi:hypothetical protein HGM15179_022024, partial [Zosterops borbonicus]